jgi:hypothetical protein
MPGPICFVLPTSNHLEKTNDTETPCEEYNLLDLVKITIKDDKLTYIDLEDKTKKIFLLSEQRGYKKFVFRCIGLDLKSKKFLSKYTEIYYDKTDDEALDILYSLQGLSL